MRDGVPSSFWSKQARPFQSSFGSDRCAYPGLVKQEVSGTKRSCLVRSDRKGEAGSAGLDRDSRVKSIHRVAMLSEAGKQRHGLMWNVGSCKASPSKAGTVETGKVGQGCTRLVWAKQRKAGSERRERSSLVEALRRRAGCERNVMASRILASFGRRGSDQCGTHWLSGARQSRRRLAWCVQANPCPDRRSEAGRERLGALRFRSFGSCGAA